MQSITCSVLLASPPARSMVGDKSVIQFVGIIPNDDKNLPCLAVNVQGAPYESGKNGWISLQGNEALVITGDLIQSQIGGDPKDQYPSILVRQFAYAATVTPGADPEKSF